MLADAKSKEPSGPTKEAFPSTHFHDVCKGPTCQDLSAKTLHLLAMSAQIKIAKVDAVWVFSEKLKHDRGYAGVGAICNLAKATSWSCHETPLQRLQHLPLSLSSICVLWFMLLRAFAGGSCLTLSCNLASRSGQEW